ncbi:DUF3549 family protein [Neptunomonas antarctica]|uniref:DUF3549 domain-containing protein n=1 Tax=Neptunomonas antarctica TaxID=619304 RepID=A0A1N7M1J1_9GAMM|nr:DUF3549 family protein [Neptunomonas antarctica]SIS79970.1 Protein of unknown function [Neptunomonas antarctica]
MSQFNSISDLLRESGAQFRIFDMGRRISKVSTDQFEKLEQGMIPYPHPYLHHAWMALMLWNTKDKQQNVVWFLKFPLDEQGFLIQAVRDDFLNRLMQNISQMLQKEQLEQSNDALKDNPFSFTPDQEKMAMFHAKSATIIAQPPSQFYTGAKAYFSGDLGWENWATLGYQGIADLVARLDSDNNSAYLLNAIPQLPAEPLSALCTCLEHVQPDHRIAQALQQRLAQSLTQANSTNLIAVLLRGLSNIHNETFKKELIQQTLLSDYADKAEVLTAIATRCNQSLQYPELLSLYLEKLAVSEAGQTGFSRILADLMFIPVMRVLILQAFRNPERSDALTHAIGQMFGASFENGIKK